MLYPVKTPWLLKKLYPECVWNVKTKEKILYLTFDDGPHPTATPFVLNQLKKYNAKATFFCIGKNVKEHFSLYKTIIDQGHKPGNHTYNHLNGWKEKDKVYLDNIYDAKKIIDSELFRPPYGRITRFQLKQLAAPKYNLRAVMWDVISGDFDKKVSAVRCLLNVTKNAEEGSIILFHDSEKSFPVISSVLPQVMDHFHNKGFRFDALDTIATI